MTNNQLAENSVNQLLNSVRLARDNAERADNRIDHSFYYALTIALEELQERRQATMNSEPVAGEARFKEERPRWTPCTAEHVSMVLANQKDWPNYEVRYLYAVPQPAPELKPVGYLFVSDQGAITYSPTDWGMPGFRLAGQIFGNIDVELKPSTVVPDGIERVASMAEYLGNFAAAAIIRQMASNQLQNAPQNIPEIIPNELIAAVNRLLDSNGSRGCYNAIKCYDAHIEVERLLAAARQEVKP